MIYGAYYNMQSDRIEGKLSVCGFIVQTDSYLQRKPHILGIYRLLLVRTVDWTRDCHDEWCQVKRTPCKDKHFPHSCD